MRRALIILSLLVVMSMVPVMGASGGEPSRDLSGLTQHQPIRIDSNQAFQGVAASEGWTGDGSQGDPYVISDYLINGNGHGSGIFIGNVTSHFVIRNCQITEAVGNRNTFYDNSGLYLFNTSNGLIDGCWLDNGSTGIYIFGSELITVTSSTIVDHTENAIGGAYSNNLSIAQNTIRDALNSIYFSYLCDDIQIRENFIKNSRWIGIGYGSLTSRGIIEQNMVSGCTNIGIFLSHTEHSIVRFNTVRWCPVGIQVEMSEGVGLCRYNNVSNNTLKENTVGIRSDMTLLNTYEYNNISHSGSNGIEIGPSSNNETVGSNDLFENDGYGLFIQGDYCIVNNNAFISNHNSTNIYDQAWVQARDDGIGTYWALKGRGNYWTDWTIPDNDSNGIVDLPYSFQGRLQNEDPFPLADHPRPQIRIPSPPLDLQGTSGRYFIKLSWNLPLSYPDYPIDGFYLYKNSSGSGGLEIVETLSSDVLDFTDPDLVPGMTYGYAISAFNEKGESSLSNPVILQVTELFRAPVVQIIGPVEGSHYPAGNVEVTWTVDLMGAELHHFEIGLDGETWTDIGTNTSHTFMDQQSILTTIHIRCFNDEGTFGADTVNINIDSLAPEILISSPTQDSLINSSTIRTNWTIIEDGSGIGSVRIRIDDKNWTDVSHASSHTFTNIFDSIHTITIEATDNVGNSANISVQFTVDTIPPSVLDIGPAGFDAEKEEIIYMDFGDEIDPSSVEFFIFPETPGSLNITDLRVEFTPDEPLVPGEEYFISIYFSDEAGNRVGPYQWNFRVAEYYLEGTVSGYVVDSYDEYVQGAMVTIGNVTVFTDIFGKFNMDILPGEHDIFITKEGYIPYAGNVTILPTQELDLGKLVIEGGNSPIQDVEEDDIPWVPIFIVILVIGGVGVGIMSIKNKAGNEDLDVEE